MERQTLSDRAGIANPSIGRSVDAGASGSRDLEAALVLLAERARFITGSSGSSIALMEGADLICRASAGTSAPDIDARIDTGSGLIAECLQSRNSVNGANPLHDTRDGVEGFQNGAASVLAVPLLRDGQVIGVLELAASRPEAFAVDDVTAVERIARLVVVALDDAAAPAATSAVTAAPVAIDAPASQPAPHPAIISPTFAAPALPPALDFSRLKKSIIPLPKEVADALSPGPEHDSKPTLAGGANVRRCASCGFPVSGSRLLCLDCEAAGIKSNPENLPFAQLVAQRKNQSWLRTHLYTIGTVLVSAGTIVLLILYLK
jgi:hypothetical protein